MKWTNAFIVILLFVVAQPLNAQDQKLLMDKPGTFTIDSTRLRAGGACAFTKDETAAASQSLVSLIEIFHKEPVLADPKGFDGVAAIYPRNYEKEKFCAYQAEIVFYLKPWEMDKNGKPAQWVIEPPQWRFEVNHFRFLFRGEEYFLRPGAKQQVGPGIDRYGDYLVVYNPNRPSYLEQVTIREVFRPIFDLYKRDPDPDVEKHLHEEYSRFSEAELDSFAYRGPQGLIFPYDTEANDYPVMRLNKAYWNTSLPRSAIQIMELELPSKEEIEDKMELELQKQQGSYYIRRLLYELNLKSLAQILR